jgi:sterol desaturase/sphingolipid hydroxylase (fatty acid hydroxylase superfamily)
MIDFWIPVSAFVALAIMEGILGAYNSGKFKKTDWITCILSVVQFIGIIRPLIIVLVAVVLTYFFPEQQGFLSEMNFWYALIGYLLIDDFLHYWVHRIAHESDWLWRYHETHHASEDLNVFVTFKTNLFWLLFLPELYFGGACLWMGLVWPLIVAHTFKGALEFFYHFNGRPDLVLHRNKYLKPIGWLLERLIVLQDTHHAHHGNGENGRQRSNYSGTLMIWDLVFGTAYFPHGEQGSYGVDEYENHPWYYQLYYPLVRKKSAGPMDEIQS